MANLILVEGPDNSGKTTLIDKLNGVKLNFPKKTDTRFTIETRNEVAIFETMLKYIDTRTYILDRGYISNIVYGRLRGLDEKVISMYRDDLSRLIKNHNLKIIGLTRDKISINFCDDLIKLSTDDFNKVIDMFNEEYKRFDVKPIKILEFNEKNELLKVNEEIVWQD